MSAFPKREAPTHERILRVSIAAALHELRVARFDGNPNLIEALEKRLNWLLDEFPRPRAESTPTSPGR